MDLGPTSTLHKGSWRRGKGPYIGVRLKGEKWVSEIRIPKTKTRIWLGTHHSPEKAARAYDAALYCIKGEHASFNFPNNRRPNVANLSVGSLTVGRIQCIAAEFSCLDESMAKSEPSSMSPSREAHLSLEPPVLPDPKSTNESDANKVANVPEELYVPTLVREEPYVQANAPGPALMAHANLQLDELLSQEDDWMRTFFF